MYSTIAEEEYASLQRDGVLEYTESILSFEGLRIIEYKNSRSCRRFRG